MSTAPQPQADVIKIIGLKSTVRQLKKLNPAVVTVSKAINKEVGDMVARGAAERVHSRSGKLAGTIRSTVTMYRATVKMGSAAVKYAAVNHFGWPKHNYAPNPVLYDEIDARRGEIVALYAARVHEIVEATVHPEAD